MKKKSLIVVLLFVLFLMIPSNDVEAASKKKVYKAYYSWLIKKAPKSYKEYSLVKLDSDKIPELIGHYQDDYGMHYYIICAYNGKKVVTNGLYAGMAYTSSYTGSLYYIPKKGKILQYTSYAAGTQKSDEVYKLKKGKLKVVANGTFEYRNNKSIYRWNDKKVSKSTYNKKLKKAFNQSKAKSFGDIQYYSKSKMKKKLK